MGHMMKVGRDLAWSILRAQSGDRQAFDSVLQSIQLPLFKYIRNLTQNETLAEDILQEVFLLIYRKLRWLEKPDLFFSWMYKIATREAWKHLKRQEKWTAVEESLEIQAPGYELDSKLISEELPKLLAERWRRADGAPARAGRPFEKRSLEVGRRAILREPELHAVLLDNHRERLAELAVVLHVELLVRELVEQRARDVLLAAVDHRAQDGIGEIAERRISARAAAVGVEAALGELGREALRGRAVEVAAIRDAARERKAPALGFDGELLRRDHVPDDVRAVERDVRRVAVVVGQPELVDGEPADRRDARERRLQRGVGARVANDLLDRLALAQQLDLAADRLQIIGRCAAGRRGGDCAEPERAHEPRHERRP